MATAIAIERATLPSRLITTIEREELERHSSYLCAKVDLFTAYWDHRARS